MCYCLVSYCIVMSNLWLIVITYLRIKNLNDQYALCKTLLLCSYAAIVRPATYSWSKCWGKHMENILIQRLLPSSKMYVHSSSHIYFDLSVCWVLCYCYYTMCCVGCSWQTVLMQTVGWVTAIGHWRRGRVCHHWRWIWKGDRLKTTNPITLL